MKTSRGVQLRMCLQTWTYKPPVSFSHVKSVNLQTFRAACAQAVHLLIDAAFAVRCMMWHACTREDITFHAKATSAWLSMHCLETTRV